MPGGDAAEGAPDQDYDSKVESTSVADLIARRLDVHDPWRLALVQRHLVWDEVRMAALLDSLLAGYPIGSLLVCRVRGEAHVLRESGVTRTAEIARAGTWQLLDGQQRVNALISLFTEDAKFGRFYLDMTRRRIPEEVVTRRRDTRRALDYIAWRSDDAGGTEPLQNRERFVELGRVHAWGADRAADQVLALTREIAAAPRKAVEVLNEIDSAFADELLVGDLAIAADRTIRVLRAWSEPSIPVQYFTVDGPSDVLQVFSRINLAGVRLDGEDVFFAAVKTEWPNAEEHLDRVAAASPLLNRMTALRLLARLASRARSNEDLLPLRVNRLNGTTGKKLVEMMERLASDESRVLARIGTVGNLLTTESAIGYGLRLIDDGLLDHVFAWAAVHPNGDEPSTMRDLMPSVEGYLLGAHAFRYPSIFRDGFLRLGFSEAVAAGAAGQAFPIEQIVAVAHRRWSGLRRGQNSVVPIDNDDRRRGFVDQNAGLFLSILQAIPFSLPPRDAADQKAGYRQVEWDHIYPQAKAAKMRVRHPETGRLVHHADRRLVWNGGNLWALDRPINNFASDIYPSKKFALVGALPDPAHRLPSAWPTIGPVAITDGERADLLEAERLIVEDKIEAAMPVFRRYAVARGLRLFETTLGRYPDIALFAPSASIDPDLYDEAPATNLWEQLGLGDEPEPDDLTPGDAQILPADDRFASVFALADRANLGPEVRAIIAAGIELGLQPRPRSSSVMLAPRANRTRMLFTIWPQAGNGGRLSIYRWAPAIAEFFPEIEESAARDALGPDGYGILDREDVLRFVTNLRELLGDVNQGDGTGSSRLTGDDIRRIAYDWLRTTDPARIGIHYYEIAHAAERQGLVSGSDRMATVLGVLRRPPKLFDRTGPGMYTWIPSSTADSSTSVRPPRYWALRTDPKRRAELWDEIQAGRLRQGWGWDPDMDLQVIAERLATGEPLSDWQRQAWANRRMLTTQPDGIHPEDLVLVPHMPETKRFSVVRVVGPYEYDGGQKFGDYGHILPVRLLTGRDGISYTDPRLPLRLQTSLGNRIRLWNLDAFGEDLGGLQ